MNDKWLFCDTEDNSKELDHLKVGLSKKIVQIVAKDIDGNCYDFGDKRWKFLRFLRKECFTKVVFHNLQYDLGSIFWQNMDELDIVMVGGRIIKAHWKNITFIDSLNMFPMSVKKLAPAFGLEKLEFDSYSKEYAFQDVEVIRRAMLYALKFAEKNSCKLPNTLGSLSIQIFKTKNRNWKCSSLDARQSLYGGRVELFQKKVEGELWYCDINSLYPYCMTLLFPTEFENLKSLDGYGAACVDIEIPECFVAPLPFRRDDNSIMFPIGLINGTWTIHEIQNAVNYGAKIKKVYWIKGSKTGKCYYKNFVLKFYKERLKAENEALKLMLKLLMNSSYGQLGMSGKITRSIFINEKMKKDIIENDFELDDSILYGCKILKNQNIPLPNHVNYIHAAYITSYGRIELFKHLSKIEPKNLIYCDTDSVIFKGDSCPFEISNELGKMKIEKKGEVVETFAPKCYRFDEDYKAKGIKKNLAKEYLINGKTTDRRPFKIKEAARFFDRGNTKPWGVWHDIEKEFSGEYDKKKLVKNIYYPIKK